MASSPAVTGTAVRGSSSAANNQGALLSPATGLRKAPPLNSRQQSALAEADSRKAATEVVEGPLPLLTAGSRDISSRRNSSTSRASKKEPQLSYNKGIRSQTSSGQLYGPVGGGSCHLVSSKWCWATQTRHWILPQPDAKEWVVQVAGVMEGGRAR